MIRLLAILVLALAVPLQAGAAACVHLCTFASGDSHAVHHDAAGHDADPGHHCDKPDASGKCCQGHGAVVQDALRVPSVRVGAFDRAAFVARWASFIPEEPSPPPIVSTTTLL